MQKSNPLKDLFVEITVKITVENISKLDFGLSLGPYNMASTAECIYKPRIERLFFFVQWNN